MPLRVQLVSPGRVQVGVRDVVAVLVEPAPCRPRVPVVVRRLRLVTSLELALRHGPALDQQVVVREHGQADREVLERDVLAVAVFAHVPLYSPRRQCSVRVEHHVPPDPVAGDAVGVVSSRWSRATHR